MKPKGIACTLPWQHLFIDKSGKVKPSCHCFTEVGNIKESSLEKIWNNEGMQLYRKKILEDAYRDLCFRTLKGINVRFELIKINFELLKSNTTCKEYALAIDGLREYISQNPANIETYFLLARMYEMQARFDLAIEIFNKLLDKSPENQEAHYELALIYYKIKDYVRALKEIKQIIQFNPVNPNLYLELGRIYRDKKDYILAVEALKQALELGLDTLQLHLELAMTYREKKDYSEAIEEFKKAIQLSPDRSSAEVRLELAKIYRDRNDDDLALKELNQALALGLDTPGLHLEMGKAYRKKEEYALAIGELKKALKLDPDNKEAHFELGTVYREKNDYDLALKELNQALALGLDTPGLHVEMGTIYREKEEYVLAVDEFKKAVELGLNNDEFHLELGKTYQKKVDYASALKEFKKALKINPANNKAHLQLGIVYRETNDCVSALRELNQALRLGLDTFQVHFELGRAYLEEASYTDAIEEFRMALTLSPGNSQIQRELNKAYEYKAELDSIRDKNNKMNNEISLLETGRNYVIQKDCKIAKEIFKEVIQLNPDNEEAHFELGKIYYIQEKYPEAIERLKKAITLNQNNAYAHLLLAKSYKAAQRYQEAVEEFKKVLKLGYHTLALESGYEKDLYQLVQKCNFDGRYELTKELAPELLKSIPEDNIFLRNKVLNELEIAQGKTILESKPRRLTVTLSNRCNLSCIMCLTRHTKWEIPKRVLDEIYALFPYLEKIMWQGGEVFALDFFEDILYAGFQYPNLRHSIVTNGQLINENIAEKLVKNNVELTISIDGVSKEVYEYIRRGADFGILLKNLKLISELKRKYKSNMVLNLNVAIMKSNYHQLEEFIDFGKEYGFEFICLMPIHIHLKTPEDIFTNQDIQALTFITKVSPKIEEKARQYGIRIENRLPRLNEGAADKFPDEPKDDIRQLLCHIPWQQLLVDYDGSVRPDCLCRIERSAGSLLENLSLEDIWNNEAMVEYRKRILNHNYVGFCNNICSSGKICESHLKIP